MQITPTEREIHRKRVFVSLYIPIALAIVMCLVRIIDIANGDQFYHFGIEPRTLSGLAGIVFAPFLHSGWGHLGSNLVPFVILFAVTIYSYRTIAYKIFLWIWLLDGIGVWLVGRDYYHVGASGIIYGLASFLFFSGIIRKNRSLLSLALFVIVWNAGLIWGIFPIVPSISWEAHLFGLLSGIGLAVWYRKGGPEDDKLPDWYYEEDKEENELSQTLPPEGTNFTEGPQIIVKYEFKPNADKEPEKLN